MKIKNFALIQAPIGLSSLAGSEYKFDVPNDLRDKRLLVQSIRAYTSTDVETTSTGRPVIDDAAAKNIVVTIRNNNNKAIIEKIPYLDLVRRLNSGTTEEINSFAIELQSCNIICTALTGNNNGSSNVVALFGLAYVTEAEYNAGR